MYGYATDETEEMMPLTIILAHKLNQLLAQYRRDGTLPWARPDSKTQVCNFVLSQFQTSLTSFDTFTQVSPPPPSFSHFLLFSLPPSPSLCTQVTVEYRLEDGACIPLRVHTVVVSVQHSEDITLEEMKSQIIEKIVKVNTHTHTHTHKPDYPL